jgi:hypothetical protein
VLAANPGQSATVLVALAATAGTRRNKRAGKEMKLPPPASAFSVPATAAAKNRNMAWMKCKPSRCTRKAGRRKTGQLSCGAWRDLLQVFDFFSDGREQGRRQFGISFLNREWVAVGVDPIQEIA